MAALDAAIQENAWYFKDVWMAGLSPAMTIEMFCSAFQVRKAALAQHFTRSSASCRNAGLA
jgi:hypothetical protein